MVYNKQCYKIFRDQLTYFNAQLACASMGAYLATIKDQNEFNFIQSTFYSTILNAPMTFVLPLHFLSYFQFESQQGQVWVIVFFMVYSE